MIKKPISFMGYTVKIRSSCEGNFDKLKYMGAKIKYTGTWGTKL